MGGTVNTNVDALIDIKDSLVRFQERIAPLQSELNRTFAEIDEQLEDGIRRKLRQSEERQRIRDEENRTDSFVCDRCGGRMFLKVLGDTSQCREAGCSGTLRRVYTEQSFSAAQRANDLEDLEEMRRVVKNYNQQKEDFLQLFSSFFSSEAQEVERGVITLSRCIEILEQYLGIDFSVGSSFTAGEGKTR